MTCRCDRDPDEEHGGSCEEATITKGEVVEMIEAGVGQTIEDYLFWRNDPAGDSYSHEDAVKIAVEQAVESATCWLGIGSCAGGGCKH